MFHIFLLFVLKKLLKMLLLVYKVLMFKFKFEND